MARAATRKPYRARVIFANGLYIHFTLSFIYLTAETRRVSPLMYRHGAFRSVSCICFGCISPYTAHTAYELTYLFLCIGLTRRGAMAFAREQG